MYTAVRTIRRKALVGFARQRELHGVSAPRDGVRTLAEELSSGVRASSSIVDDTVPSKRFYVTDAPGKPTVFHATRQQERLSSTLAGEVPKLAPVTTRSEHSAAVAVDDEKGYESSSSMEDFVEVGHKLADAARAITVKYFRRGFQIIDKEDLSPVTVADRETEAAMCSIITRHFPGHAMEASLRNTHLSASQGLSCSWHY